MELYSSIRIDHCISFTMSINHFKPRQLLDGKWHYANEQDKIRVQGVGYCQQWVPWEEFWLDITGLTPEDYVLHDKYKYKHHVLGHDTPEDACECYRMYLIDHARFGEKTRIKAISTCMACKNKNGCYSIIVAGDEYVLCPDCCDTKGLERCFPVPGESWQHF